MEQTKQVIFVDIVMAEMLMFDQGHTCLRRFWWSAGPNFDPSDQTTIEINGKYLMEQTIMVRWTREQV